jgi:hypothetical protein
MPTSPCAASALKLTEVRPELKIVEGRMFIRPCAS